MELSLNVTIVNMCTFVVWDYGAEAWIVQDDFHDPLLAVSSRMVLPPSLKKPGNQPISLNGYAVSFGVGDPAHGGTELPMAPALLGGATDQYINLLKALGDVTLAPGWIPGEQSLPANMVTRIKLPGGTIVAETQQTAGGQKTWTIGMKSQMLTSQSTFVRSVSDVPFIRLANKEVVIDIPIQPDSQGLCAVTLGVQNRNGQSTVDKEYDEVFIIEVQGFERVLNRTLNQKLPIPHAYWPEYRDCNDSERAANREAFLKGWKKTDPCGGPCPGALIDLRSLTPAARVLDLR